MTISRLRRDLRLLCYRCVLARCTSYISKPLMIQVKYPCPLLHWNTDRMEWGKNFLLTLVNQGFHLVFSQNVCPITPEPDKSMNQGDQVGILLEWAKHAAIYGKPKDWKAIVSLRGHILQSSNYLPLDAPISFFPCIPVGMSSFTLVKIVYLLTRFARKQFQALWRPGVQLQWCFQLLLNCKVMDLK